MSSLLVAEINAVERSIGHKLPSLYRRLLTEVGYGQLNVNVEIYHPAQIQDLYESFFDDPKQLFNPYFPFGCQNHLQEIWVIDAAAELAASLWHETAPEDWPEVEWLTYDRWTLKYLQSELPNVA